MLSRRAYDLCLVEQGDNHSRTAFVNFGWATIELAAGDLKASLERHKDVTPHKNTW